VANAWKREHATPETGQDLGSQVHAWGESGSLENVPRLVAALTHSDGNVRRLAASALGKLRAPAAVEPLCTLLEHEPGPQVRQYAIKALRIIGDPRARATLERIAADADEIDYNREGASAALLALRGGS
jgi:HEAT repeat protein